MNSFDYIKTLDHHAYFIHAFKDGAQKLKDFLKKEFHIEHSKNPDFFHEKFEMLTIDDSRRIKEIALGKKFSADTPRIFIIELYGATREAQNALLKLFEEPEPGNHFFIIAPSIDILLPTLRSRLLSIDTTHNKTDRNDPSLTNSSTFLKSSLKDKIAYVDKLSGDISDDITKKHAALDFLNDLEYFIYQKSRDEKHLDEKCATTLKKIAHARTYMNDRAPSIKMLLEYIALTV